MYYWKKLYFCRINHLNYYLEKVYYAEPENFIRHYRAISISRRQQHGYDGE